MKCKLRFLAMAGVFAFAATMVLLHPPSAAAASITNAGSGDWSVPATWIGNVVPDDNDDVVIQSDNVLVTNETKALTSLLIRSTGMLTMSNWTTRVHATTVTITNTGAITLPAAFTSSAMSNRVWIACSNLTIASGAKINVDGKGWAGGDGATDPGHGPGAGLVRKAAAGYGGSGGRQEAAGISGAAPWGSLPYGSASAPTDPGSGGGCYGNNAANSGGAGGGAVRIEATGLVTVNGTITANGNNGGTLGCGGSGGGIYITCNTIQGAGTIRADGGKQNTSIHSSAGGGRIAVVYNSGVQAELPVPGLVLSAGTAQIGAPGDIGTLYCTDNRFLYRNPLTGITGQWSSAVADIGIASLTMSNAWIRLVHDGVHLTVTNELRLTTGARLEVGGNVINPEWWWDLRSAYWDALARPMSQMASNPELECGSLTLTNGAALWVFAGLIESSAQTGALVKVTGNLTVATNSWIYPVSHLTNGGSVCFSLGGLNIQSGGGINADGLGFGYPRNNVNTVGYGPGPGRYSSGNNGYFQGGGYGGFGGGYTNQFPSYGITNGSETVPLAPGSAGGAAAGVTVKRAGAGGGLVWIKAPNATITVDGTITANGGDHRATANQQAGGAGSGGGIYILCKGIAGGATGIIRANGGSVNLADVGRPGATGGGGRIAIWRVPAKDTYGGNYYRSGGTGGKFLDGTEGTLYLGEYALPGGTIVFVK